MLIAAKQQGGVKLFDIYTKEKVLKIAWVKVYHEYDEITILANKSFSFGKYTLMGNLNNKDIIGMVCNGFWLDVALAWCEYNYITPTSKEQVLNVPIWLNSQIKNNENILFNAKAIDNGVQYIRNIVNDSEFMSFAQIQVNTGGAISITDYYAILQAIDVSYKRIIRNDIAVGQTYTNRLNELIHTQNVTSLVYDKLISRPEELEDRRCKYINIIGLNIYMEKYI